MVREENSNFFLYVSAKHYEIIKWKGGDIMKVIRGGIYKVSNAWKKYNDALLDHRPVIVIQCNEEFVYGVLMGALPREAKHKNALYFECEVSGKRYISLCACDTVHKIPIRYIKDNLGYISIPTLWEICDRTQEYITFEKEMIEDSDLNVDREKNFICIIISGLVTTIIVNIINKYIPIPQLFSAFVAYVRHIIAEIWTMLC